MRAMILAAGRGSRMRSLTDTVPKPLLTVGGKPLIVWHIERLKQAGFTDIVINHAYLGAQIEQALGTGEQWGVQIRYSPETAALETAGGIANALPLLTQAGEERSPFLVVNGDIFTDIDFSLLSLAPSDLMHLVMVENPEHHPGGDFSIVEGRLREKSLSSYTFSGVGVYHPDVFNDIKQKSAQKLAPLLHKVIANNKVTASLHRGVWHDIGTPERLDSINAQIFQKK